MIIQFVYFGKRGGGVNDLISLLNSIKKSEDKIYSLNNILIKKNTVNVYNDIQFDYLSLPNSLLDLVLYTISFKWLQIFSLLNKNKPEHVIITMFHPLNIYIFIYKYIFFKRFKIYYFLHNDNKIQTFNKITDQIIRFFDIFFCFLSNKILLLSESVHDYATKHFFLKHKEKFVIGFGVYYKHDAIVHNLFFYKSNPITFIFFGKILEYKGLDTLVKALEILNKEGFDFKCYIIGEGELKFENFLRK